MTRLIRNKKKHPDFSGCFFLFMCRNPGARLLSLHSPAAVTAGKLLHLAHAD